MPARISGYAIGPYTSELDLISGRIDCGTMKNLHSSGSHFKVSIFINIVRDAFDTSVMCNFPLVRFCLKKDGFKVRKIKRKPLSLNQFEKIISCPQIDFGTLIFRILS